MNHESFVIGQNGAWECKTQAPHHFDINLASSIRAVLEKHDAKMVLDLGCGDGRYTAYLKQSGIQTDGYDGNPNTPNLAPGCRVLDLTKKAAIVPADWVICLEVGEHIPEAYERTFVDNVTSLARHGIILSWFPTKGHGIGHVNEHSNEYVINLMAERGFINLIDEQKFLRKRAIAWWFKHSLMVFARK